MYVKSYPRLLPQGSFIQLVRHWKYRRIICTPYSYQTSPPNLWTLIVPSLLRENSSWKMPASFFNVSLLIIIAFNLKFKISLAIIIKNTYRFRNRASGIAIQPRFFTSYSHCKYSKNFWNIQIFERLISTIYYYFDFLINLSYRLSISQQLRKSYYWPIDEYTII